MKTDTTKNQTDQDAGKLPPSYWVPSVGFILFVLWILILVWNAEMNRDRPPSADSSSRNNLKQIQTAADTFLRFEGYLLSDIYHSTDRAAEPTAAAKPLLSWRVRILPYIEQKNLYNLFRLDEPWDSPHNLSLIEYMPDVYHSASSEIPREKGKANFLAVKGSNTTFSTTAEKITMTDIKVCFVEVNDASAVVWTRPGDLTVDSRMTGVLDRLKGIGGETFLVSFLGGRIESLDASITPEAFYRLCTGAAGKNESD